MSISKQLISTFSPKTIFKSVEIETTSICNRKCSYCPNSLYHRPRKLLPEKTFCKIIDELAEIKFNGSIYPHHYGEPLLDKRLEKFISYTRKKLPKTNIEIFTNGDFLTQKRFTQLINAGANQIRVTNHDNQTPTHIKTIINNPANLNKIIFYKFNPKDIPLFNRGGLVKTPKTITSKKCLIVNNLVIDYLGNVTLCCNDYLSQHVFGNVKQSKIIDIWNQKDYQTLRYQINRGIFLLPICQRCNDISPTV